MHEFVHQSFLVGKRRHVPIELGFECGAQHQFFVFLQPDQKIKHRLSQFIVLFFYIDSDRPLIQFFVLQGIFHAAVLLPFFLKHHFAKSALLI